MKRGKDEITCADITHLDCDIGLGMEWGLETAFAELTDLLRPVLRT